MRGNTASGKTCVVAKSRPVPLLRIYCAGIDKRLQGLSREQAVGPGKRPLKNLKCRETMTISHVSANSFVEAA